MNDLLSNHGEGGESTKVGGEGEELRPRSEQAYFYEGKVELKMY